MTPLPELDPAITEQLKASVPQPLFEKIDLSLRLSHERLHRLETENRILRELRRLDLLEKYGPAGEQVSDEQRQEWKLLMELRDQGTLQLDNLKKQVGLNKASEAEVV